MTVLAESKRFPDFDSMRAAHSQLMKQYALDASDPEEFIAPVQEFLSLGQATGALLDSDSERESAQTMLDYWTNRLYRIGKSVGDTLLVHFDPEQAPEIPDELCPYRGLNAFNEEDNAIFFGRQKTIDEMVERFGQERFMAVVGPSGSGKSSIVRAGLLPSLRKGMVKNNQDWVFIPIFVPSSRPLANLLVALNHAGNESPTDMDQPADQGESLAITDDETAAFLVDSTHLLKEVQQRFNKDIILSIDQFEEIFTLCDNSIERQAFVENLITFSSAQAANHHVIVTMRVDFESKLALYPELQQLFEKNTFRLTPLTASDLRQAIEEPARQIGLKFDDGLIDNLLNDILGEPAALPLLQFTLLKLWEHRVRNRITMENYRQLGGGRQALANSADEFYNSLIPEDQVTARRILLRLVRPGEGMEVTSQRMRRLDLYSKSDAADRIDRVLEKFIDARLLRLTRGPTPYDDQIEVAHEALVRNWPTLVAWLEDERESIRQRRRLTTAAERWNELGCTPDLLLRGVALEEALRYDDRNALEEDFVQASQQARADEVEQAKKVARELRRRNRIITYASIVAAIIAVVAIILGGIAYNAQQIALDQQQLALDAKVTADIANDAAQTQAAVAEQEKINADIEREKAETAGAQAQIEKATAQAANTQIVAQQITERALSTEKAAQQTAVAKAEQDAALQKQDALARQLADQARSLVSRQTDLGVLLGLEAAKLAQSFSDQGVLLDVLRANSPLRAYYYNNPGAVNSVAYRSDGQMVASAGADKSVNLWISRTAQKPENLVTNSISELKTVGFSPTNDLVAAGGCAKADRIGACGTGLLIFWELDSGKYETSTMEVHRGTINVLQFDPSGQRIATGGSDGVIHIWKVPPKNSGLWTAEPTVTFTGNTGPIRSLAFSPSGRFLVSTSDSNIITVHNLATGEIPAFPLQKALANALAFTPDSRYIAVGSQDANIYIYDMTRFAQVGEPLRGHTFAVTGLDFNQDGTSLVSSSEDGTVILWDLGELVKSARLTTQPKNRVFQGHTDAVLSVAFAPTGKSFISAGRDSAIIEWYTQNVYPMTTNFITSSDAVIGLGIINDIIVNRSNRSVTTWNIETGISSNGDQWVQTENSILYPDTVSQVLIQSDGSILGLKNNQVTSEEILGVDVTEIDGYIDWAAVKSAGYKFAFTAATEGVDFVDSLFNQNWAGIGEAGLIRGATHVFYPTDDPLDQAAFFAKTVPWEKGDLPPVVIVEDTEALNSTEVLLRLQDFQNEMENLTGRKPIIFTSPVFWFNLTGSKDTTQQSSVASSELTFTASDYGLWIADYTMDSQPNLPTGWGTWTFWNYTDQGTGVPGINSDGIFLNRFNGNLQALQSLATGEPSMAPDAGVESTSLIDLKTNQRIGEILPLLNPVSSALHPQGNLLAIGSRNGAVTFWNLTTGYQTGQPLVYSTASIESLAFDSEGRYLAAGNSDGDIILWDLENGGTSYTVLDDHTSRVISLAFGGKGLVLASGSADGSIFLWDLQTKNPVGQPIIGPNAAVTALAVDKDEKLLAAGFADGTLLIWDIDFVSWDIKACQRAGRSLTESEWNRYLPGIPYQASCP